MGPRIAYRCAISGLHTFLTDRDPQALQKARNRIEGWLTERSIDRPLSTAEATSARTRLHFCNTLEQCLADVDLVIETVPENLNLKRQVFAEIDRVAPAGALLATNSSSIPCSRIADVTARPGKVFNINFSDPTRDLLVEIMKGALTDDKTIGAAERFVRSLKMVPITTLKESPGFSFNRIWRAVKREALHLVADGYCSLEDIDRAWILDFGTKCGPFGLMDIVGIDIVRDIEMQYYLQSREEGDRPPQFLDDLIAQGRLGVKNGKGFYSYPNPEYKQPGWLLKEAPWTPDKTIRIV